MVSGYWVAEYSPRHELHRTVAALANFGRGPSMPHIALVPPDLRQTAPAHKEQAFGDLLALGIDNA